MLMRASPARKGFAVGENMALAGRCPRLGPILDELLRNLLGLALALKHKAKK